MSHRFSTIAMITLVSSALGCSASNQAGPGEPAGGAEESTEAAALGLHPETNRRGPGPMFAEADQNKDGTVTLDEARAVAAARFALLDSNQDGQLDSTEQQAMRPGKGAKDGPHDGRGRLQRLDRNRDGKISRDEAPQKMQERFDVVDTNRDGALDQQELQAMRPGKGAKDGPSDGRGRLQRLDRNGDGKISRDEAPQKMQERFDAVDTNRDGALDQQELQAMHARRMAKGSAMTPRIDSDGDGKVSQVEFTAAAAQWFSRLDGNSDSAITREELQSARHHHPTR